MSRENVELVRRAFEAFATRGLDVFEDEYFDPDVEYIEDPLWPGASSYKGREAVAASFRGYTEALGSEGEWSITVERVEDGGGNRLAAFVRFASQGTASGAPHEHVWGYALEVQHGR